MDPEVDAYIAQSHRWPAEMAELRPVLLGCGLTEAVKWGKPCYAHDGHNVAIMQEMKDFLALMFFKGALLSGGGEVLRAQGPNSRSARRIEFTSVDDVTRLAASVTACVEEAIAVEEAGLGVAPAPDLVVVDELRHRLDRDERFRAAFEALTPGRRREYNLYVADAKRVSTRQARIDRCTERILAGKGLRDRS